MVDKAFQHICLLAKTARIKENLSSAVQEHIYEFPKFMFVLDTGLNMTNFSNIQDGDYDFVIQQINIAYQS